MDFIEAPAQSREQTIHELREISRKLVRELGFMRNTLAESDLPPSAVHAILEIAGTPGIQARDLAERLRLDKSSTSRQVTRLESAGLVERRTCADDARSSELHLTKDGQQLRRKIDAFASGQVSNALRHLTPADQQRLVASLSQYVSALADDNDHKPAQAPTDAGPQIVQGYVPGCIGDIASLHGRFYAQHWGFGVFFERRVAKELADFAQSLPDANKALWLCVENNRCLASLAIDGNPHYRAAHLRWFIVDDSLRGTGIGRKLMSQAMRFVDERFDETYLNTFKGLDAARHLYESFGFQLTHEEAGTQWGSTVTEQQFRRRKQG
ncbi:helix-turn-helix domain-containing GNAT family N-acetyltransferase [Ralstonia sp. CHL-2022]|uniref:Helix-turn-helix domain-containing GNAT family N-acetyltransferase n=1 Tax=Ralstonia mojiangensis TaxID=2953895 RepID=A0ABT2LB26_9RALS|nr:helix-turn-helix domain-containing GNAT family N-acetyltransferase [Ralstonia mojiangensis]MCT7298067.1 helix-turn-helix domain-containing GNAT family N-acetyltransferase [Ralstonia mojiangensis]MCT7312404.1 helix-turn-helix domain-containing GNAT family N-acetyltransferase [Ralstonia mojiangensis]